MKHFGIILITLLALSSCKNGGIMSGSNLGGKPGELLIVINDKYKNSEVNVEVSSILNQYEIGLTQSEPPFSLLTISRNHFSSVFRPHRNILFIDVDKKYTKPLVQFHKNMWTDNQAYVGVGVSNTDSLISTLKKSHKNIIDYYIEAEINRYVMGYKAMPNQMAQAAVRDSIGIIVQIPNGYNINKAEKNFVWLSQESNEHSQGLIIYQRPYKDTNQLEKLQLLSYRDSITKTHIPGPSDGSYMTTEYILPIKHKVGRYINDDYTVELRGKWRVEHDFMAGPFCSYTFVNKNTRMVITIEGYVYYPNKSKRNYMRQLQAISRSVKFISK